MIIFVCLTVRQLWGFVGVEESDLYLHPDFDTFEIFPWRPHQGKVARLICDVYKPDGTRLESDQIHSANGC